ncbi:unnamed protein product [Macrosiphum euphorbiae]|uniref:Ribosomal protein L32 n=1 Tax=Macrosiphum euphorbiae TaxID=13131 RepID=A0AAV0W4D0_9HEMI|nr:unnamed protein product [Macrosiphum euphorbiae]
MQLQLVLLNVTNKPMSARKRKETSPTNSSGPSKRWSSAANTPLDGLRLSCGSFLNATNSPGHPSLFKTPKKSRYSYKR